MSELSAEKNILDIDLEKDYEICKWWCDRLNQEDRIAENKGHRCLQVMNLQIIKHEYKTKSQDLKEKCGIILGETEKIVLDKDVAPEEQQYFETLIRILENYKIIIDDLDRDEFMNDVNYVAIMDNHQYLPCIFSSKKEEHECKTDRLRAKIKKLKDSRIKEKNF